MIGSINLVNLGMLVIFTIAATYTIYQYMPEKIDLKRRLEDFSERQKRVLEKSNQAGLTSQLKRAGISIHPAAFRLLCYITASIVMYIITIYTMNPVAGLVFAILGYQIPHWGLSSITATYDSRMGAQIKILISTTSQTILSSGSMVQTINNIIRVVDEPLKNELRIILGAKKLGKSLERGFTELAVKTGHSELATYAKIINIADTKGVQAAADSFKRLDKVVALQSQLSQDKKAQLAEYAMFIMAMIIGLPAIYIIACGASDLVASALKEWMPGKIATVAIAAAIVGSYLGFKASTKDAQM